jgi:histidine triad (HIT) family protein
MQDCIFCQISQGKIKSWKVLENQHVYAFLDINPVNAYHTIVMPKSHYKDIFDVPKLELQEIMSVIKRLTTLYKEKVGIEDVQIINNSGSKAQQEVLHIHFHIVPRHKNDGQDIRWNSKVELRDKFDEMISKLND